MLLLIINLSMKKTFIFSVFSVILLLLMENYGCAQTNDTLMHKSFSEQIIGDTSSYQKIDSLSVLVGSLESTISHLREDLSYVKATKQQIKVIRVRDTVYVKPDSTIMNSLHVIISKQDSLICRLNNQQSYTDNLAKKHSLYHILFFVLLFIVIGLFIFFNLYLKKWINQGFTEIMVKLNQNANSVEPVVKSQNSCTSGVENEIMALPKPSLEAYNSSVYEFVTINDQIASLKRKESRTILMSLYRFLALQDTNVHAIIELIRESGIPDGDKEQFVSLVSQVQAFISKKKPIIDSWLKNEPKDGVSDYISAIRLPINQVFDDNLDRDVLGEDLSGQTISFVYKMGYYFPGNTIRAYREKSIVSC